MANVAHFCLQKLHLLPSEFYRLPLREKAFVIASIQLRIESEKDAMKKAKKRA